MELNWELCRIFYQVARCRNFSRAAAMLFTSQRFRMPRIFTRSWITVFFATVSLLSVQGPIPAVFFALSAPLVPISPHGGDINRVRGVPPQRAHSLGPPLFSDARGK